MLNCRQWLDLDERVTMGRHDDGIARTDQNE